MNITHQDRLVNQFYGDPVPEHAARTWRCGVCFDRNEQARRDGDAEPCDAELHDGDRVIFFASSKEIADGTGDAYVITRGVHHERHHGDGREFSLDGGTKGYYNALVTATVKQTGYDYGEINSRLIPSADYEPDYEPAALTFDEIDVLAFSPASDGSPPSVKPRE